MLWLPAEKSIDGNHMDTDLLGPAAFGTNTRRWAASLHVNAKVRAFSDMWPDWAQSEEEPVLKSNCAQPLSATDALLDKAQCTNELCVLFLMVPREGPHAGSTTQMCCLSIRKSRIPQCPWGLCWMTSSAGSSHCKYKWVCKGWHFWDLVQREVQVGVTAERLTTWSK